MAMAMLKSHCDGMDAMPRGALLEEVRLEAAELPQSVMLRK